MQAREFSFRLSAMLAPATVMLRCTFENGQGFSKIESGSVTARLEPGGRDLGNQTVLTDLGYHVKLDSAKLEIGEVALERGSDTFEPIVTISITSELDWLDAQRLAFEHFAPSRELPLAEVSRVTVTPIKLTLAGSVNGVGATTSTLTATLAPPPAFQGAYSWKIDRDAPEKVRIDVDALTDGTLFDGIDFDKRAQSGAVLLSGSDDPDVMRISESLMKTELTVERK